jgi:hypothetical protein
MLRVLPYPTAISPNKSKVVFSCPLFSLNSFSGTGFADMSVFCHPSGGAASAACAE